MSYCSRLTACTTLAIICAPVSPTRAQPAPEGGRPVAQTARIAVIQPQRPNALASARQKEDEAKYKDHAHRLDPAHDDFDRPFWEQSMVEYIEHLCGLLHEAGEAGCDLVLLPECCLPIGGCKPATRERLQELCPWAEQRWLEAAAPIARQHQMLIASCYYRAEGEKLYNDAVLMDERGEVAGVYHKVHLPCPLDWDFTEAGLFEAGDEYPLFDTKLGKIGFLICYDIDFPEVATCYALQGADLLLHPTVGYNFPDEEELVGEARLRTRATDNSVPIAYANFGPSPGRSAVYSHNGNQIACAGRQTDALVFADLELGGPRTITWGSNLPYGDHRERLMRKRRPDTYRILTHLRPPFLKPRTEKGQPMYEYAEDVGLK